MEVVNGANEKDGIGDLVFTQTSEGYTVDENAMPEATNATLREQQEVETATDGLSEFSMRAWQGRQNDRDILPDRIEDDALPADGKEIT